VLGGGMDVVVVVAGCAVFGGALLFAGIVHELIAAVGMLGAAVLARAGFAGRFGCLRCCGFVMHRTGRGLAHLDRMRKADLDQRPLPRRS
jgi:hypothetical protein